ncbi:MAG: peptidoglycan DD-metalloendopeptidase family protein [Burkholderiaceae bacterium]
MHDLRFSLGEDDLDLASGEGRRLVIQRGPDGLAARIETIALIRTSRIGYSRIVSSLFAATHGAGIPDKVASQIVDVLGGEIDFERDIRQGDELRVIYETLTEPDRLDLEYAGRLLAVELSGRGKSHSALWLEHDKGRGQYYDFQGRSASRSFLRYPIEYARISSGFSTARMHPVFGRKQAHLGVDFAAPPGTRIRASGDGVVEFVGTQRGYGRVVILNHNKGISTVYAHMRGFAKGITRNTRLRRGDVIGYVGSSGWATGPHLHYEYRVGGDHRNPLSVELPEEAPLSAKARIRHAARAEQLRAQLNQIETVQVAGRFE